MEVVKIIEGYLGYYSKYCLADEFDNHIYSEDGILIYNAKDGNVVQTIQLGETQELFDEYFQLGMDNALDYELSGCYGCPEESQKAWEVRSEVCRKRQNEIFPQLLQILRRLLPESIQIVIDDGINEISLENYFCNDYLLYDSYEFYLLNEIDGKYVFDDDRVVTAETRLFKDEFDEIDQPVKVWLSQQKEEDQWDLTPFLSTNFPKYWEHIMKSIRKELVKLYGESNEEKINHMMKGKVFYLGFWSD